VVISPISQRRRCSVEQAGERSGVAAQHGGAEQLGTAALLLCPGVPHHQEHHHEADAELGDLRDLVRDDAVEGVDGRLAGRTSGS
jgi:hypothetical protein